MAVKEFSADAWQASAPGLAKGLDARVEKLTALNVGLTSLAESADISGEGADAMRAYIREVQVPIVQALKLAVTTFQTAVGKYSADYYQVDGDGNFWLVNDELEDIQTQLEGGVGVFEGFAEQLRGITTTVPGFEDVGSAAAGKADKVVKKLEGMHAMAKGQLDTWTGYEDSDHGFAQVRTLMTKLSSIVHNVGAVSVGRGRSYVSGGFNASFDGLGELLAPMEEYCHINQEYATEGWERMFSEHAKDVEEADRLLRDDAWQHVFWNIWNPNVNGYLWTALTGQKVDPGWDPIIKWYDVSVAGPAKASGNPWWQFFAGLGDGVLSLVVGLASFDLKDLWDGVSLLLTSAEAREQWGASVGGTVAKVVSGDWYAIGKLVPDVATLVIPFGAGAAVKGATVAKEASAVAKAAKEAERAAAAAKAAAAKKAAEAAATRKILVDELLKNGAKVSPEKVVTIFKTPEGRIVWLEKGIDSTMEGNPAGLAHIIEDHGAQFAQKGISEAQIPEVLTTAIQKGRIVRYQGQGTGRPIYEFEYGGKTLKLAITISDNGFIVGANFSK